MSTAPRIAGNPNGSFFVGGLCALGSYYAWPSAGSDWEQAMIANGLAGMAGIVAIAGLRQLANQVRIRKHLLDSEAESVEHGSAREASEHEMEQRGCFDPSGGMFIGFKYGRAVFAPADCPFKLIEGPPGSSKDICLAFGDVLHHSLLGYSVYAPDVKLEMGPSLIPGLQRAGVETWAINPTRQFTEICGNVELGLYQVLLNAVYSDADGRKDAVGTAKELALLLLPDEKSEGGKKYFIGGSRRCLSIPPLLHALIDPARCTPADSFDILNDPVRFSKTLKAIVEKLEPFFDDDRIVQFLKSEARNLLSREENNPENLGSFLEWSTQALSPFNQAGHLSDYAREAAHNMREVCERPITVFTMTPHSHAAELEAFVSLQNHNLLAACKRSPKQQRVHLCLNEFLNYRFVNIASDLELMRGLGITASLYIQSFNGLVRKLGKEAAASVNDYCDVKIYLGINSQERAKYVSEMLSETTINSKDYSYRPDREDINVSSKRHSRRLMTTDEILSMPRDRAWAFIKGLRPVQVQLRHYGHIEPWNKGLVGTNPLEGPPLEGRTLLHIDYPNRSLS